MPKSRSSPIAPLTAARDRGPSQYFHGRKRILRNFGELLKSATQAGNGTTFLIQGAPGVGKTALIYECEKRALESGWGVASIPPHALWDPGALLHGLGGGRRLRIAGGSGKLGFDAVVKVEAELDFAVNQQNHTVLEILEGGKKPLLLMLDEAQVLGMIDIPSSDRWVATSVLNCIHNGDLDRPVILLAAGLGTTLKSFETLGISRFAVNCFVELRALDKGSERAVIQDWIEKEGGAKGDSAVWIDAIAKETHGWPQHIQSYANLAADQLKANGRIMTPEGLHVVLEAGRESRKVYYKQRVVDFYGDEIQCLVNSIPDNTSGLPFSRIDIMSSLTKTYGDREAKNLFDRFIRKGILEKSGVGLVVAIPSMHAWMKDEYSREKIEFPREPEMSRDLHERNSGLER